MFDRFKLSRNKQNHSVPEIMTINGQDCSNTQGIAEHFSTFFAKIGAQNESIYVRIMDHTFVTI